MAMITMEPSGIWHERHFIFSCQANSVFSEVPYSLANESPFKVVESTGQIQVKAGVNINFELWTSTWVTLLAEDGISEGFARITLLIEYANVVERPSAYSNHNFRVVGTPGRSRLTLNWSNDEWFAEFEEYDRKKIEVKYGPVDCEYCARDFLLQLDRDATSLQLAGLVPGIEYSITLAWFNKNNTRSEAVIKATTAANAAPSFTGNLTYTREENNGSETTAAGTAVATIAASDADARTGELEYGIWPGADATLFSVDEKSGEVSLAKDVNFNFEGKGSYTVGVTASDLHSSSVRSSLTVNITGIDEAPELPPQSAQSAVVGTAKTFDLIAASVRDRGDSAQYEAQEADGTALPGWLTLNAQSGRFSVSTSAVAGRHPIRVRAVSTGNSLGSGWQTFMLAVAAPASNALPGFAATEIRFSLTENEQLTAGQVIGTIAASDSDGGDTVSYSIRGADAGPFEMGASTGILKMKNAASFDHEAKADYSFAVDADDGKQVSSAAVVVAIVDVNEPPQFISVLDEVEIAGGVPRKDYVLGRHAVDPEGDAITYAVQASQSLRGWMGRPMHNSENLVVSIARAYAKGGKGGLMTLVATDSHGLSSSHVLKLTIVRASNRPPSFSQSSIRFAVPANGPGQKTPYDFAVGSVALATDPDMNHLLYRMVPGFDEYHFLPSDVYIRAGRKLKLTSKGTTGTDTYPFYIVSETGELLLWRSTEFVPGTSYEFKVSATDSVGRRADLDVEVVVENRDGINAKAPGTLARLRRATGLSVALLGEPQANVTLTLTGSQTGHVDVLAPATMVFTPANWYTPQVVSITLTDAGRYRKGRRSDAIRIAVHMPASSAPDYRNVAAVQVPVSVSSFNRSPIFSVRQRIKEIAENTGAETYPAGTAVGTPVAAIDFDEDELVYSLVGTSSLFGVDSGTGQVTLLAATLLDHEIEGSYEVTIMAADKQEGDDRRSSQITMALMVRDVNEAPVLAGLADQRMIEGVARTYQVPEASDPEDGTSGLVYTATAGDGGQLPAGVMFTQASRTFEFANTLTDGTIKLRVVVADQHGLQSEHEFTLVVDDSGAVVANTDGLGALSRLSREASFGVQLAVAPASAAVTLTLESLDPSDVTVTPATMEFTTGNWNTAQDLTVRLTDAGAARRGSRVVNVSLGVHGQASSDLHYQGSTPLIVPIPVSNANAPPVFDVSAIGALNLTLDENQGTDVQASAMDVGAPIAADDADNPVLGYSLLEGGEEFAIASDGQLSARSGVNFNHERQPSHEVVVVASDGEAAAPGVVPGLATVTVTVQVNDVEEKPEVYTGHGFASTGQTRNEIMLGWSNSEYESQFDAEDRASIVVSFGGSGYKGTVELAADATHVRLVGLVPDTSYDLSLHWYSADGIAQDMAAQPVSAVMTGANMDPVLGGLTYSRDEDAGLATTAAGTAVATVSATDGDGDEIAYSIRGGADAARFVIDAQSGVVRLAETVNLDREGQASYTFEVAATDSYGGSATGDLVLNMDDVVEDPVLPVQYAQTAQQGEGLTITLRAATNPQDMSASIEYSAALEGGGALPDFIEVDAMNGQLTVDSSAQAGTWRVVVRAMVSSGGGSLQPATFTEPTIASERIFELSVTPAANSVPSFGSVSPFALAENSEFAAGHSVGTVAATDADAGDTLNYSLRGEDAAPFAIGDGGVLTLKEERAFDHEGKDSWKFVVDVDDGNGGLASTEVEVMITGVDEAPVFLSALPVYRVVGRMESDFVVQPAVDPESDSISYTFSRPGTWLSLDASDASALVFTAAAAAPVGVHQVTLTATAAGESVEHEFVIEVQTAGNHAPQFASALESLEIETTGMVAEATAIGSFVATDADDHVLSYRIVSGDDAALFAIDAASGRVEVAAGQQLAAGTYRFTVEVSDGNGGFSRMEVAVEVTEVVPASSSREDEVALAVIDRLLATTAADMIRRRLDSPVAASGGLALGEESLEDEPPYMRMASAADQWSSWRQGSESDGDRIERMEWKDFLYSRGFDLALDDAGGSRGTWMRLWGSGSRSALDGAPEVGGEQVRYDGTVNVFMLGLEAGRSRTRIGIAGGRSQGKLSLSDSDARVERSLNTVHSYLSFRTSESMRLWAAGSFGKGDYVRFDGDDETTRDARHVSAAGGLEGSWNYRTVDMSAGMNVLAVQSRLSALASESLAESKSSFWRTRIDFEAGQAFEVFPETRFRPFLGVGLRRDGGDDWLKGHEVDATAGMSLDWSGGLNVRFTSHWQASNGVSKERRIDGSISYDFAGDGRGLMLSASPSMESGSDAPWSRSLGARVGYGLPVRLLADSGIATFSAELSGSQESLSRRYGFSFAGRRLDVDLSAGGDAYRISLKMR